MKLNADKIQNLRAKVIRNGGCYDTAKYRYTIDCTNRLRCVRKDKLGTTEMLHDAWEYIEEGEPLKSSIRQAKYDNEHTTQMMLKFNNVLDADILERLNEVGNKQGYIKRLIRNDLGTGMPSDEPAHTSAE